MTRIPLLTMRAGLSAEQQPVYDAIVASRGGVRGAFPVLLHRPGVAAPAERLGDYVRFRTGLDAPLREAVQLLTAALLDAEYELASHRRLAAEAGLAADTITQLAAGRIDDLQGDIGLAVRFTRALLVTHRVPDPLFAKARTCFGTDRLVDLAALIGYYAFACTIQNAFGIEPPAAAS